MAEEEATQQPQEKEIPQEDVKPEVKPEPAHLTLTVVHQVGLRIHVLKPVRVASDEASAFI